MNYHFDKSREACQSLLDGEKDYVSFCKISDKIELLLCQNCNIVLDELIKQAQPHMRGEVPESVKIIIDKLDELLVTINALIITLAYDVVGVNDNMVDHTMDEYIYKLGNNPTNPIFEGGLQKKLESFINMMLAQRNSPLNGYKVYTGNGRFICIDPQFFKYIAIQIIANMALAKSIYKGTNKQEDLDPKLCLTHAILDSFSLLTYYEVKDIQYDKIEF